VVVEEEEEEAKKDKMTFMPNPKVLNRTHTKDDEKKDTIHAKLCTGAPH
jgi:hypothetical protein